MAMIYIRVSWELGGFVFVSCLVCVVFQKHTWACYKLNAKQALHPTMMEDWRI